MPYAIAYFAVISLIAVIITVHDKLAAKRHKWRVRESTLLLISALGGSFAMLLTMRVVRHKTRHTKFMVGIPVIIVLQIAVIAVLVFSSCGQAVPEEQGTAATTETTATDAPTATEESTTEETIPDPVDNEPTSVLLERRAEELMREIKASDGDGFIRSSLSLSKSKTVLGAAAGDLNGDGKDDLAVTVNLASGSEEVEDTRETCVLLAEGGAYKARHANIGLVRGPHEGGVFGDPFDGLSIEDGALTVSLYGGSSWKWGHSYQFRYAGKQLMLTKTESFSFFFGKGTQTICDYVRGTCESRLLVSDPANPDDSGNGPLLHKGTFSMVKSTFEAPVIDDATYDAGVPHAPYLENDFYEAQPPKQPNISAEKALDVVQKAYYSGMKKVQLLWTDETRATYETFLGYEMPDWCYENEKGRLYYFSLDKKYENGDEAKASWLEHTIWYESFALDGDDFPVEHESYRVNDPTGEIL